MDVLKDLRKQIDQIDEQILVLFTRRFSLVKKIGIHKKKHNIQIMNKNREEEKLKTLVTLGQAQKLSASFIKTVWKKIFIESYKLENSI